MESKGNKREASFLPEYVEEFDLTIGSDQNLKSDGRSKFKSKPGRDHVITVDVDDEEEQGKYKEDWRRKSSSRSSKQIRNQLKRREDSRTKIVGMSSVMDTVNECISQVYKVINRLGSFANGHKLLGKRKATGGHVSEPCPELKQIAEIMQNIIKVTEATFPPAHRLCQASIGFYLTEDFIRDSYKDPSFDYFTQGRIRVPNKLSNQETLKKIKTCVNMASEICSKWSKLASKPTVIKRRHEKNLRELCEIMSTLRTSIQNLYNAAVGAVHLFDMLVYLSPEGKASLLDFINSLEPVQRADLLEDISSLRRLIDYIPLIFEKLTWKCYAIHSLAGGKPMIPQTVLPKPSPTETNISSGSSSTTSSKQSFEKFGAAGGQEANMDQNGNEIEFQEDFYENQQEGMNTGNKRRSSTSKLNDKMEHLNINTESMMNRKRSNGMKTKGTKLPHIHHDHPQLDLKESSSSNLAMGINLGSSKVLVSRKEGKHINQFQRIDSKSSKDYKK